MARGTTVQYVQFYTAGSAARQVTPVVPLQKTAQPSKRKYKKIVLRVDPVAALGMVVAVLMLVLMISGFSQLQAAQAQTVAMEQYVQQLQAENAVLEAEYTAGYDAHEVEQMALALGMVPSSQVQHVNVQLSAPQEPAVQTLSFWDQIGVFLAGLFA